MAPATKYGGKIVVCQLGSIHVAKSNETVECIDKTSRVEIPARTRYAISYVVAKSGTNPRYQNKTETVK
jgi:hypothetical protein